jgi:hypothetical protein
VLLSFNNPSFILSAKISRKSFELIFSNIASDDVTAPPDL